MNKLDIQIQKLTCKRCDFSWIPRVMMVKQCPRCKSYYWNEEKKIKIKPDPKRLKKIERR